MSVLTDLKSANCTAPDGSKSQPYDVLIIGAGISGCAAAVTLARQGRSVILLEKNLKEPDRIVGELLQPGGVAALEKLVMRECLEGIDAVPLKGYQVFIKGRASFFGIRRLESRRTVQMAGKEFQGGGAGAMTIWEWWLVLGG
jgi:2-polyprenyl-6-methoxyphenol hydroxylase-like FAD-dependent oxidoreductase